MLKCRAASCCPCLPLSLHYKVDFDIRRQLAHCLLWSFRINELPLCDIYTYLFIHMPLLITLQMKQSAHYDCYPLI